MKISILIGLIFMWSNAIANPFFKSLDNFTTAELYIITALNAAYVGGTVAFRGGRIIDLLTDKHLVCDFGIYSAVTRITKVIQDKMTEKYFFYEDVPSPSEQNNHSFV